MYVEPIVKLFGSAPDEFEKRARELGGVPATYGDRGMKFFPFPEIPVTYVLWTEDNEFPASVNVMFDKSIERWFSLDMKSLSTLIVTVRIANQ